jgi:hypothetical protein
VGSRAGLDGTGKWQFLQLRPISYPACSQSLPQLIVFNGTDFKPCPSKEMATPLQVSAKGNYHNTTKFLLFMVLLERIYFIYN